MHPLYAPSFHWKGFTTLPYFALLQFPRRSMPDSLRFLSLVQTLKKHVGGRGVRAPSGKGFLQPSSNREAAVLQDDYLYRERSFNTPRAFQQYRRSFPNFPQIYPIFKLPEASCKNGSVSEIGSISPDQFRRQLTIAVFSSF